MTDLGSLSQAEWDALLPADAPPFQRHAFLHGLEQTGCVGARTGWTPEHLTLWDGARLGGAVPLYRKTHSYGEYVFDWAWADAYETHGYAYYPKLVAAVPFTPVPGPRLLAANEGDRAALADALLAHAARGGLSSLHVLFPTDAEAALLETRGCMLRFNVQFHWQNAGFGSFEDYLAALSQPKRKKIRAERRRVREEGIEVDVRTGHEASADDWRFFHCCYVNTYRAHHSAPYLKAAFFEGLARTMPESLVLFIARRGREPIAASLLMRSATRAYGRYWGSTEFVPCLHFETAYYRPIEWAIGAGIEVIEGGAQGEHKLARGFLPVRTASAHWLAHPAFADAVERFLARETGGIDAYLDELNERLPFRRPSPGAPTA